MTTPITPTHRPDALAARLKLHGDVPEHVAIIMDGNGRWAHSRRLPRPAGHQAGMRAVRAVVEGAIEIGVRVLTLFAFSKENWSRPAVEISALMMLLEEYIAKETAELCSTGVEVHVLGELSTLGPRALAAIERVTDATAGGTKLQLNLCISYSSRAEITRAAQLLAEDVVAGRIRAEDIDESRLAAKLYTAPWGDPDLLIRTSGEQRVSNFLLWQLAYTELYVTPVLWPDFDKVELFEAVQDYQRRERRFGRVLA